MAELAALQLVQSIGVRFTTRGPTKQEVGAKPPPSFRNIVLNIKKVKNNMWIAFIEKLFINYEIGTIM